MDEIASRDLEEAWPGLVLKLQEFQAQLLPPEAGVFEAIIRAAAEDAVGAESPEVPPDLRENNQPQRDRLTRLLLEAIAQLPSRLALDRIGGAFLGTSGAALDTTALPLVQKLAALAVSEAEREGVRVLLGTAASTLARGSGKLPPPARLYPSGVFDRDGDPPLASASPRADSIERNGLARTAGIPHAGPFRRAASRRSPRARARYPAEVAVPRTRGTSRDADHVLGATDRLGQNCCR